jgi:hypothetical protein
VDFSPEINSDREVKALSQEEIDMLLAPINRGDLAKPSQ